MSRGDDRRTNDLENFEAAFREALARAVADPKSAYVADKQGRARGGATPLDVELFTLESKIDRLRQKLGLPAFTVPLPKVSPAAAKARWPAPPAFTDTRFSLDLSLLQRDLEARGQGQLFAKVHYAGAKHRQGADQPSWRLAKVVIGENRTPAQLTLTVFPLPAHADADLAAEKLGLAQERLVAFCEKASQTPVTERPRHLHVSYSRGARALGFHAG